MRPRIALLAGMSLLAGLVNAPAGAGPTTGGLASDNVEHVAHVPIAQNGVGGRLIGKHFYMNDQNKIMIFDVSTPEDPQLTGFVTMPQEWQFSREDIDGNGDILVVPNTANGVADGSPPSGGGATAAANAVYVIDVEDKTNPQIISKINGPAQHTYSCVLDCKWAWGSEGAIIDLRDPANPVLMEEKWGDGMPAQGGHDVEEIAPGLLVTATQPVMYLDARKDPLHPKLLAKGGNEDNRYMHGARWPQRGRDKFLLMAGETTFNLQCDETSGAFMTWDARKWRKTKTFTMIDEYRVENGTWVDGNPAVQRNCTSHWHEEHPDFRNGGLVAVAFYDHGTRFLEVSKTGKISDAGWFMPYGGQTSAVYWITDEIVYSVDYNRGLDVLRFNAD
ncbi:MAG TPA: hypothetical protein VEV43_04350 [Actinomycetota bacterium]|nr:hypothetical protein [Actinomycetota bacterium]